MSFLVQKDGGDQGAVCVCIDFNSPPFFLSHSTHYLRFLMPLEQEMRTAGTYVPGKEAPPDEDAARGGRSALAGADPGIASFA